MHKILTNEQLIAYITMLKFLENYNAISPSDDIRILLGSAQLDDQGISFDEVIINNWKKEYDNVIKKLY